MEHFYLSTLQKATTVSDSVLCNFTSNLDTNLVLAKWNHIQVYLVSIHGLRLIMDVPIFGRIAWIDTFRPKNTSVDLLLLCTENYELVALRFDIRAKNFAVVWKIDFAERLGRQCEKGILHSVDRTRNLLFALPFQGILKVFFLDNVVSGQPIYTIRVPDLRISDLSVVQGEKISVALLVEQSRREMAVKVLEWTHFGDSVIRDLSNNCSGVYSVDPTALRVICIPAPMKGLLVIDSSAVSYISSCNPAIRVPFIRSTITSAYCSVSKDGLIHLLGTSTGKIYRVQLIPMSSTSATPGQQHRIESMKVDFVGITSIPSCLAYINRGIVFVGSHFGDSMLVQMPQSENNDVLVLDRLPNLAPIVDFQILESSEGSKNQIITCSGGFSDGSLRIIRNGLGITQLASTSIRGIQNIWRLRTSSSKVLIVLSTWTETFLYLFEGIHNIEQVAMPGFATSSTIYAGNSIDGSYIQVTQRSVRVIWSRKYGEKLRAEWSAPANAAIVTCEVHDDVALVVLSSREVSALKFYNDSWHSIGHVQLEHDVSCAALYSLSPDNYIGIVGLWNSTVTIFEVSTMKTVLCMPFEFDSIPRSVAMCSMNSKVYLFVALGDGQLEYGSVDPANLGNEFRTKCVRLSSGPCVLTKTMLDANQILIACSDCVTAIYCAEGRVRFSSTNISATAFCVLDSSAQTVIWSATDTLVAGLIDDIQRLEIKSIRLGEQPRRLAIQKKTSSVGVLTCSMVEDRKNYSSERNFLRILDDEMFQVIASYEFQTYERVQSVESLYLENDDEYVYVVGTAFVHPDEEEAQNGRICVFALRQNSVELLTACSVDGTVYCLKQASRYIVAGVNSKILLLSISLNIDKSYSLNTLNSLSGQVMSLFIDYDASTSNILVGDLMKSMSLYHLDIDQCEPMITKLGRHCQIQWMTAVNSFQSDVCFGADHNYNIFSCSWETGKRSGGFQELNLTASINIGEFVNRFRKVFDDGCFGTFKPLLYGTVAGSLGVIIPVNNEEFQVLKNLESNLQNCSLGVGGLSHASFRSFKTERKSRECLNFIDGNLVDIFLDLDETERESVLGGHCGGAPMNPDKMESIVKLVENLSNVQSQLC